MPGVTPIDLTHEEIPVRRTTQPGKRWCGRVVLALGGQSKMIAKSFLKSFKIAVIIRATCSAAINYSAVGTTMRNYRCLPARGDRASDAR
jgi:hypothetical protein